MSKSNNVEVSIGGKVIILSGNESEEYLHKVTSYINNKIADLSKADSYKRTPHDMQSILLALNIADDFFKSKEQIKELEQQIENKEKDLYNIKHELIASQIKLENVEKNVKTLETKNNESQSKVKILTEQLKNQNDL